MHRRALLSSLLALVACAPQRLPPPPPAPRVGAASELIPADLDVVVRLDLSRMRAALGGLTPELLSRDLLSRAAGDRGEEPDELVVRSLLRADVVHLAYRPSAELLPLDRVLVLQGDFGALARPPGFSAPTDLGADLRYWEKAPGPAPLSRSAVARLYALGERALVFVSEAEIDAVERALSGLGGPRRLSAPAEGALSLALRPRLLAPLTRGTLRELLEEAERFEAVVDLESDGARLALVLVAAEPAHAQELARAGQQVLARALGDRAKAARLSVVAERLTFDLRASREELGAALGCLRPGGASASGCPW